MVFDHKTFLLSSIMLNDLIYEQSLFHLSVNCLRKCALIDPQSNSFPLKFPNP